MINGARRPHQLGKNDDLGAGEGLTLCKSCDGEQPAMTVEVLHCTEYIALVCEDQPPTRTANKTQYNFNYPPKPKFTLCLVAKREV